MKLDPSDPNLETLVARIDSGALNLQPDFQRGEVWGTPKKQRLIDSVLRGWHIPPLHIVFDENTGMRDVLDGQQRLAAIRDFVHNDFPLKGDIAPLNKYIQELDGLYYSQLPKVVLSRFNDYSIRTFILTDFDPEEPGELFFRLNQPTNLTSAEQRNAFYGDVRQQIKELVAIAENIGIDKGLVGFSNSRMAYDDVIAKLALTLEQGTLQKKITGGTVTERYRIGKALPPQIFDDIVKALQLFQDAVAKTNHHRFNKATLHTWLLFSHQLLDDRGNQLTEIEAKGTIHDLLQAISSIVDSGQKSSKLGRLNELHERDFNLLGGLVEIYSDRATSRVSDVSSVVLRDFAIWCVAQRLKLPTSNTKKEKLASKFAEEFHSENFLGGHLYDSEAYAFVDSFGWDIY